MSITSLPSEVLAIALLKQNAPIELVVQRRVCKSWKKVIETELEVQWMIEVKKLFLLSEDEILNLLQLYSWFQLFVQISNW